MGKSRKSDNHGDNESFKRNRNFVARDMGNKFKSKSFDIKGNRREKDNRNNFWLNDEEG